VERDDQADGLHLRPGARFANLLAQAVPFPTAPEAGTRIKMRLLNGTDDRALTNEAATFFVAAGAEIDIVGNATSFDVPETTVGYSSGGDRQVLAGWIAGVLKTQNIEELPPAEDEIDVTVILGNDARDLIGR
jgi:LytR cell envelope-related transcriptional attenuator